MASPDDGDGRPTCACRRVHLPMPMEMQVDAEVAGGELTPCIYTVASKASNDSMGKGKAGHVSDGRVHPRVQQVVLGPQCLPLKSWSGAPTADVDDEHSWAGCGPPRLQA